MTCSNNTLFQILTQTMSVHITSLVPVSSAPGVVYQLGIMINNFVISDVLLLLLLLLLSLLLLFWLLA